MDTSDNTPSCSQRFQKHKKVILASSAAGGFLFILILSVCAWQLVPTYSRRSARKLILDIDQTWSQEPSGYTRSDTFHSQLSSQFLPGPQRLQSQQLLAERKSQLSSIFMVVIMWECRIPLIWFYTSGNGDERTLTMSDWVHQHLHDLNLDDDCIIVVPDGYERSW